MGSSKKQTTGYRYYMGLHFGLCHGPVDHLQAINVAEREAWAGSIDQSESVYINGDQLFGGDKKEGGVAGKLDVMMGGSAQGANSYLASKIGAAIPAFRGILSAVFRGGMVSSNNPYVKPWAFRVDRILNGWSGGSAWYPSKAVIDTGKTYQTQEIPEVDVFKHTDIFEYITRPLGDDEDYSHGPAPWKSAIGPFGNIPHPYPVPDFQNPNTFTAHGLSEAVIWVRKKFYADADAQIKITFKADNVIDVWLNGMPVALSITSLFTGETVQASLPGENELIFRVRNLGEVSSDASNPIYAGAYAKLLAVPSQTKPMPAMNPAHIIYECLTNNAWGMGYPASAIDDARFTAAADTLFTESFGLCMIWNKQETIENFIKLVLEHIGAILYVDPTTGKFALKLIRDDYVASTLPVFGPSNLVAASDYQRKAWGETVNEVTVVYRDLTTNKDASITVQDLANIQTQGAVVAQTKQYPGIPIAPLAQRVAMRDLNTLATPLARVKLTANRRAWSLIPGDVFRLSWPDFGVVDVVFRVLEVNRGTLQDGSITIDAVEDVFGLPSNTYVADEPGGWVEPTSDPQVAEFRKVVEAPYWDLALSLSAADLAYIDPLSGYVETMAARPSGDSINYEINAASGSAEYAERAVAEFCPTATLALPIDKMAASITFIDGIDVDLVAPGGYAIIGDEYVAITAIDAASGSATIGRGVLDTVPVDHAAGARVWFADGNVGSDPTEYASGEVVGVKLLPRTGLGELSADLAPVDGITMAQRHNRPYPPGMFRIVGQAYPAALADVALSASWAHRDRLTQTAYLVTQSEGHIGPEAGTTYTVQLWNQVTEMMLQSATGLTGFAHTFAALPGGSYTLRIDLWSVRDGLASHQKHSHVFDYININLLNTEDLNRIASESGDVIELE